MIGADERLGRPGILHADARAPMAADIEKRPDLPVFAANDDDRFTRNRECEIVPRPGNPAGVVDQQPLPKKNPLDVALENAPIVVEWLGQTPAGPVSTDQIPYGLIGKSGRGGRKA